MAVDNYMIIASSPGSTSLGSYPTPVSGHVGTEYAQLITGLTATNTGSGVNGVNFNQNYLGGPAFNFALSWTNPTIPPGSWMTYPFGGVHFYITFTGMSPIPNGPTIGGGPSPVFSGAGQNIFPIDFVPVTGSTPTTLQQQTWTLLETGQSYNVTLWAVSLDADGQENTFSATVTPGINITWTWPLGSAPSAAIYTANPSNFTLGGTLNAVNTTLAASIAVGSYTVTPASMTNIAVNMGLFIDTGAAFEVVKVTGITGSTFTATFTKAHTGPGIVCFGVNATGSPQYVTNGAGQKVLQICASWCDSTCDAQYGGSTITYSLGISGAISVPAGGALTLNSGAVMQFPIPTAAQLASPDIPWYFYLVSQDINGNVNSSLSIAPVSGTPSANVTPSAVTGGSGTEFTALVTSVSVSAATLTDSNGNTFVQITVNYTTPTIAAGGQTFGGARIRIATGATISSSNLLENDLIPTIGAGTAWFDIIILAPPLTNTTWYFDVTSYDVNNNLNSVQSTTPHGSFSVSASAGLNGAYVQAASIGTAAIGSLQVTDAKIASVAAGKITAGTIIATVLIEVTGTSVVTDLSQVTESAFGGFVTGIQVRPTSGSQRASIGSQVMGLINSSGQAAVKIDAAVGYGEVSLYNGSNQVFSVTVGVAPALILSAGGGSNKVGGITLGPAGTSMRVYVANASAVTTGALDTDASGNGLLTLYDASSATNTSIGSPLAAWTPTITFVGFTCSSYTTSGKWQQIGKWLFFRFYITFVTSSPGGSANAVEFSLPSGVTAASALSGSFPDQPFAAYVFAGGSTNLCFGGLMASSTVASIGLDGVPNGTTFIVWGEGMIEVL